MNRFSFDSIFYLFKQKKSFVVLFYASEVYCFTLKLSFDLNNDSVLTDVWEYLFNDSWETIFGY